MEAIICSIWRIILLPSVIYLCSTTFLDIRSKCNSPSYCTLYLIEFIREIGVMLRKLTAPIPKLITTYIPLKDDLKKLVGDVIETLFILLILLIPYAMLNLILANLNGIRPILVNIIISPILLSIMHGYVRPFIQKDPYNNKDGWFKNNLYLMQRFMSSEQLLPTLFVVGLGWVCHLWVTTTNQVMDIIVRDLLIACASIIMINLTALIIYISTSVMQVNQNIWETALTSLTASQLALLQEINNSLIMEVSLAEPEAVEESPTELEVQPTETEVEAESSVEPEAEVEVETEAERDVRQQVHFEEDNNS